MPPAFLYFDLGNVLLTFSHQQMCRQMAEVAGVSPERVWQVLFDTGLELRYEAGQVTSREFYEEFCEAIGARPDFDRLAVASCDIFQWNLSIVPLVAQLAAAGHRLGLLSNTSDLHWRYCSDGRFSLIPGVFESVALSFEIGAVKPEAAMFRAAAERAGVEPQEIFFVDDVEKHVAGARSAGFDAVAYITTAELAAQLRARGVRWNY